MGVDNTDLFFDLMLRSSQVHIDYGSTWNYHDSGDEPEGQLVSTGIENVDNGYPSNFQLLQNYPNPFNASTRITYYIPVRSKVRLKIYDILGRRITTLIEGKQPAGSHTATFDGSQCSSGLYICVLEADQYIGYRKMVLMK